MARTLLLTSILVGAWAATATIKRRPRVHCSGHDGPISRSTSRATWNSSRLFEPVAQGMATLGGVPRQMLRKGSRPDIQTPAVLWLQDPHVEAAVNSPELGSARG